MFSATGCGFVAPATGKEARLYWFKLQSQNGFRSLRYEPILAACRLLFTTGRIFRHSRCGEAMAFQASAQALVLQGYLRILQRTNHGLMKAGFPPN
jgi:hypothetical protein